MKISDKGLALIKRFEGCSLKAYRDRGGVLTIGWGTTNADKKLIGKTIRPGMKISQATADDWFRKSLAKKYCPKVEALDPIYHWTQNEFDALVSFEYNTGKILALTANGKRSRAEICKAWVQYNKIRKGLRLVPVTGLTERREAELKLFRTLTPTVSGNPYPALTGTVASNETAAALKLQRWIPQGDMVKAVQWELCRLGYQIGAVDGICGKRTTSAVIEFQRGAGLTVDGAVGPKTWAALVAAKVKPAEHSGDATKMINYRERVAAKAAEIYPLCIGKRHGGTLSKVVTSLEALKKYDALSCNKMVSIVLQEAGCLPRGCLIEHTKKRSGKRKITDAVRGTNKLRHCKVYWVNKRFKDLPEKWQRAGVVYIQDSNACISAGGGWIWTCNKSVGAWYRVKGDYLKDHGYVKDSRVLCVIVPD